MSEGRWEGKDGMPMREEKAGPEFCPRAYSERKLYTTLEHSQVMCSVGLLILHKIIFMFSFNDRVKIDEQFNEFSPNETSTH